MKNRGQTTFYRVALKAGRDCHGKRGLSPILVYGEIDR